MAPNSNGRETITLPHKGKAGDEEMDFRDTSRHLKEKFGLDRIRSTPDGKESVYGTPEPGWFKHRVPDSPIEKVISPKGHQFDVDTGTGHVVLPPKQLPLPEVETQQAE